MMNYEQMQYNPLAEQLVNILTTKTQNDNPHFFRLQANYYLTLVASVMGTKIKSPLTGIIPVNMYGVNLLASGGGKGFSTNILENQVIGAFRQHFMQEIFPKQSELNLQLEAMRRSSYLGITPQEAEQQLYKEFKSYGTYKFASDSATTPAIKQFRNLLLLAKLGAINIIIDEIGSNLESNTDVLNTFLELYDKGIVKDKLVKNTDTAQRHQEMVGETPANIMMFGTPSKLLDGGKIEDNFFSFLDTGYARRCFFAYSKHIKNNLHLTPEELYKRLTSHNHEKELKIISKNLLSLANINYCNTELEVPEATGIELMKYRLDCEARAEALPEHMEIQKAELTHRYFKVLKLAGVYAFLEMSFEIKIQHIHQAIRLAEDSGEALNQMFQREKPYERLAKFIAGNKGKELTQVDLSNQLSFYRGSISVKNEMMSSAIAWGYKNNILIKKTFRDGIEFFTGESLDETDLDKLIISYSPDLADGYFNDYVSFNNLPNLVKYADSKTKKELNFCNHHTLDGHRDENSMVEGFNCIVLDVDDGDKLVMTKELFKEYTYIIYTTKRHQELVEIESGVFERKDRYRIILPTNYKLDLSKDEYKEFMNNLEQWLPIEVDTKTFQRSRKWLCNPKAEVFINEGNLLDILPFIPRTSRNDLYKKEALSMQSMSNLERWFAQRVSVGNRNDTIARYGFMLMDNGYSLSEIQDLLFAFNNKLENKLDEDEIISTIMTTIKNRKEENNG